MKHKRKVLGPHGGAGPGALHPLHPLRALHGRGRQGAAAGRVRPRQRTSVIDVFPGTASWTQQLLGQHRGHLPGGRAAQPRLPLPRARVVPLRGARASAPAARAAATSSSTSWARTPTATARARTRQINKSWMCDQGRLSYKYLNQDRVLAARDVGRGDRTRREATRAEAREAAAEQLKAAGRDRAAWRCSPRRWPRTRTCWRRCAVRQGRAGRPHGLRGRPARGRRRTTS